MPNPAKDLLIHLVYTINLALGHRPDILGQVSNRVAQSGQDLLGRVLCHRPLLLLSRRVPHADDVGRAGWRIGRVPPLQLCTLIVQLGVLFSPCPVSDLVTSALEMVSMRVCEGEEREAGVRGRDGTVGVAGVMPTAGGQGGG